MHWLLLAIGIAIELLATTSLKLSEGFTKLGFAGLTLLCFALAFYVISLVVHTMTLGVANALILFIEFFAHIANQLQDQAPKGLVDPIRNLPKSILRRELSRAIATPCSAIKPRIWFTRRVRSDTSLWRIRCTACISGCSADFGGTKRKDGLPIAS